MKYKITIIGFVAAALLLSACGDIAQGRDVSQNGSGGDTTTIGDGDTTTNGGDTTIGDGDTTTNDGDAEDNKTRLLKQISLDLINKARAEGRTCGEYGYKPAVDPVKWNEKLYRAAYEHSKDMALSNTFSHTGSGTQSDETAQETHLGRGSSVTERIEYNGYDWRSSGENIAAGTAMDQAAEAMSAWLKSPGHCANIMKRSFKEVGMAVYYNKESHYKYYWTQDFGSR